MITITQDKFLKIYLDRLLNLNNVNKNIINYIEEIL